MTFGADDLYLIPRGTVNRLTRLLVEQVLTDEERAVFEKNKCLKGKR
jgi:hypothetical protein